MLGTNEIWYDLLKFKQGHFKTAILVVLSFSSSIIAKGV